MLIFWTNSQEKQHSKTKYKGSIARRLNEIEILLKEDHQSLFLDKLQSFQRKVKTFGFHFASIDIRQDSRMIGKAFAELIHQNPSLLPVNWEQLPAEAQFNFLYLPKEKVEWTPLRDNVLQDTFESFGVIHRNSKEKWRKRCSPVYHQ